MKTFYAAWFAVPLLFGLMPATQPAPPPPPRPAAEEPFQPIEPPVPASLPREPLLEPSQPPAPAPAPPPAYRYEPPMPPPSTPPVQQPKPTPPPEPEPPKQPPEPPVVRIKVNGSQKPGVLEVGHLVRITLEMTGGPVREQALEIEPPIPEEDMVASPDGDGYCFTAPAGRYTIQVMVIGQEKGWSTHEVALLIRDPHAVPVAPVTSSDPIVRLKSWVAEVSSTDRATELLAVAKAAHTTAEEIRANKIKPTTPAAVVDEWANAFFLEPNIGSGGFKRWQQFFLMVVQLFDPEVPGYNAANLLDNLGREMEGK